MKLTRLLFFGFISYLLINSISAQTTTFNYTGSMQTYVVPAGVIELNIDALGAKGGDGANGIKPGGTGGRVQTTLTVSPGQTLYIYVGGTGISPSTFTTDPISGGYNGGGISYEWGGSGGGASDIRIGGTTLNDRVIVAGGGGGAGDDNVSGDIGGNGGDLIGANGEYGFDPNHQAAGTGGTQSEGGIGGISLFPGIADPAMDGEFGNGGRSTTTFSGGGGGGGYYGGGGGSGGGAGGGSSYTDPSLTSGTIHTQGFNSGDGQIVITEICNSGSPVPDVAILSNLVDACSVLEPVAPTATNCSGTFNGTPDVTFPITTQGTTTITWTYDDGNGNTSTQTQDVIITDNTAPVADITSLPNVTDECSVSSITAPTATDNCTGSIIGTPDVTFPITTQGTTTVTWTYDDGNGNTSTQTQDVIITPIDNGITQVDANTLSADATGYNYQWVDCNNGNAPIAGANSQSFTPLTGGSYACEIDNGTCTVTTDCLTSTVGIVENDFSNSLIIYPNPTFGDLSIDLGKSYSNIKITLYNSLGQQVIDKRISTSDFIELKIEGNTGIYTLILETECGETAKIQVIKN